MPIGTGIIYNVGDLILSQVSGSGTSFLETKIAAATSSIVYFDSTARINSASLNSITVGTASYVSGSRSIITNLTASNISASGTGSFNRVGIGTTNLQDSLTIGSLVSSSLLIQDNTYNNLSNGIQITSNLGFLNGASGNLNFARWTGGTVTDFVGIGQSSGPTSYDLQFISGRQNTGSAINYFTSSAVRMTIQTTTGNVGIGSTSPGAKLDVVGDLRVKSSGAAITLDTSTTSDGRMEYKYNGTRKALIGVDSDNLQISADSGNYLQFRTNGSQRMIINNAGGVGIGTSNPNYAFDVYTNGSADALMSIRASGSANARIYFDAANGDLTGGDYCHLGQDKSTLNFVINTGGSAGNIHLQPKEGTNNGILFVSGSTRFGLVSTQNHQFTGSVSVSGSVTAASFTGSLSGSITSALTASYLTPANSYTITNLTASNISASGTGSFGIVGIGTTSFAYSTANRGVVEIYGSTDGLLALRNSTGNLYIQKTTTDVYINNESNGFIVISNNGSERWRITSAGILQSNGAQTIQTSTGNLTLATNAANGHILLSPNGSGNVGIGTTTPGALLEISSSTAASLLNVKGAGGNNLLFVSGSGNVGIGTTTLTGILTVYKAGAADRTIHFENGTTAAGVDAHIAKTLKLNLVSGGKNGSFDNGWRLNAGCGIGQATNNGYLAIEKLTAQDGSSSTEVARFDTAGNLGIGTTTPSVKLAVEGGSIATVNITGSDVKLSFDIRALVGGAIGFNNAAASNVYGAVTGSAYFGVAQSYPIVFTTAGAERMRIEAGGNVGIGTTSPNAKFDVRPDSSWVGSEAVIIDTDGGNNPRIKLYRPDGASTTSSYAIHLRNDSGNLNILNTGVNSTLGSETVTSKFYITTVGNVGIGTTVPGAKLQVAGNISGSSFTSSISNAVGFLGTSSWAQNVVSASFATTAQTANALNTGNSYTISGLTNNSTLSQQGTLSMGSGYQILATTGTAPIPGISFVGDTNTGIYAPSADTLGFSISGSERVRIDSSGNVGIGTSAVSERLDVYRANTGGWNPRIVARDGTNAAFIGCYDGKPGVFAHNNALSAWADLYLNTVDAGTTNSGKVFIGGNVGIGTTTTTARLHVSGSTGGVFEVDTAGGTTSFYVSASGNVGVGTSSPSTLLYVNGSTTAGGNILFTSEYHNLSFPTSLTYAGGVTGDDGNYKRLCLYHGYAINFIIGNSATFANSKMLLDSNGNLGIGTTSPIAALDVRGRARVQNNTVATAFYVQQDDGSNDVVEFYRNATSNFILKNNGNVGIGTTAPAAKLEITGSSNSALMNIKSAISGAILYVSGSGAVGIGTSNVGAYTLQVNGSFAATTKSFVIEHPTKADKKLIYGSLESPYHGIRLTGRDTLKEGKCKIQLPDYIYKLILHDSVNIQLTGIKCNKTLYIDDINVPENYFTIAYDKAIFESYKDYEFFWDFTAIRADVPELQTEM